MAAINFDGLLHLLQASSKEAVIQICNEAFTESQDASPSEHAASNCAASLSISRSDAVTVLVNLGRLTRKAVADGLVEPAAVQGIFPGDFHKNLRDLLTKIILSRHSAWKQQALDQMVSLPRLVDLDWTVSVKSASNSAARMNVPTCMLHLQVQEAASSSNTQHVDVELSKETLNTMLDGLGRIRDQLQSVADR